MIITISELTAQLEKIANPSDTRPSEALWITFAPEEETHFKTVEYRTPDQNTLIRVYLDRNEAIVGLEIFP
jgi:hypothetical protein